MTPREKIAVLMRDGRERTTSDVVNRLGINAAEATKHMRTMQNMGLLSCEKDPGRLVSIWRKANLDGG